MNSRSKLEPGKRKHKYLKNHGRDVHPKENWCERNRKKKQVNKQINVLDTYCLYKSNEFFSNLVQILRFKYIENFSSSFKKIKFIFTRVFCNDFQFGVYILLCRL